MQQLVHLAGLLPHRDHLHHQRGEEAAGPGGAQQALPPFDTAPHVADLPRHPGVVHRIGHQGQRRVERHAGLEHHGEAAGKTGKQGALYDGADDGQPQLPSVPGQPAFGGGDPASPADDGAHQDGEQQPPVVNEEVGGGQQDPGRQRQLHPELGKHPGKDGDHHDVEDHHGDGDGNQHEGGVAHGGLDPLAGLQLQIEIVGELQEGLLQLTRVLPHVDDGHEEAAEHLRVRLHRARQRPAVGQILPQGVKRPLEGLAVGALLQPRDGAQDRDACPGQGIHLAAEDHQLLQLDAPFQQQRPVDAGRPGLAGLQLGGHHPAAHQLLGGGQLADRFHHAADGLALAVTPLVGKTVHGRPRQSDSVRSRCLMRYPRSSASRSTSSTEVIPSRA